MKYKGQELNELNFDKAHLFDPPKRLLVWDGDNCDGAYEATVYAIIPDRELTFRVITKGGAYEHCAEIRPKLATQRELAQWLARGNGELRFNPEYRTCYTHLSYLLGDADKPVPMVYSVRKYEDSDWHAVTREYLGLEDEQ